MKDKLEYSLFIALSYFLRICGLNFSRRFAYLLALLFYYLIPIRKKTVFENLSIAFPDKSKKEIKELTFKTYLSFCITIVEILLLPYLSKEKIVELIRLKNADQVLRKYKEGKGVILISAHFGNWEMTAISGAIQIGIPFNVVVKNQRNQLVNNWINSVRTKWGNKIINLGANIRTTYSVLKNGDILAIIADQRGPEDGLKLEFFGRVTSVFTGPAVLSLKTGAPIFFGIPVRQKDFTYITEMVELDRTNLPDDFEKQVEVLSQRMIKYVENIIRKHPEQWLWMHRRWKH